MKRFICLFLVILLSFTLCRTDVFCDDQLTVTFKVDDETCGSIGNYYDPQCPEGKPSYTFDNLNVSDNYYISIIGDYIELNSDRETTAQIHSIPKEGYLFDHWTVDGETIEYSDSHAIILINANAEIVASFTNDVKVYWAFAVDDPENYDFWGEDDNKYPLYLSSNPSLIDNYDTLKNYGLADSSSFLIDSPEAPWTQFISKANEVTVVGEIAVSSTYNWFSNAYSETPLDEITFNLSGLKNVKDISHMFENFTSINTIVINGFDTSKVTKMNSLFSDSCIKTLDISCFNTRNVNDMSNMFSDCEDLTSINFGNNFDTSNVKDFYCMFCNCLNLTELDLSNFNTSNATNMRSMFCSCEKLEKLDISNFDTSKVTAFNEMFRECHSLKELNLTSFSIDNPESVDCNLMFNAMENIETIYVSEGFDLSSIDATTMFGDGSELNGISNFCRNLKGENGTYIAGYEDHTDYYLGVKDDNDKCMYTKFDVQSISSKFARIDDPDNNKPGYFTRGYTLPNNNDSNHKRHVVLNTGIK